jgi:hypothetical protein
MKSVSLLALLALAPLAPAARAQQVVPPSAAEVFAAGTRLRMSVPSLQRERIVGTVIARVADTVVVDTVDAAAEHRMWFPTTITVAEHRRVSIPVALIDTLQVSVGRSRPGGMLRLAARAALYGGLALGVNYMSGNNRVNMRNFSAGFRTGAVLAAVVAAPIGFRRGQERWATVFDSRRERPRDRTVPRDPRVVADAEP